MGKSSHDFNVIAHRVVMAAVGESAQAAEQEIGKEPIGERKLSGRKGGLKGGKARMASLTEEQRHALATSAAAARWGKTAPSNVGAAGRKLAKKL